jgi:hypothetical protein
VTPSVQRPTYEPPLPPPVVPSTPPPPYHSLFPDRAQRPAPPSYQSLFGAGGSSSIQTSGYRPVSMQDFASADRTASPDYYALAAYEQEEDVPLAMVTEKVPLLRG